MPVTRGPAVRRGRWGLCVMLAGVLLAGCAAMDEPQVPQPAAQPQVTEILRQVLASPAPPQHLTGAHQTGAHQRPQARPADAAPSQASHKQTHAAAPTATIWPRLHAGFAIDAAIDRATRRELRWLRANPRHMRVVWKRAEPFLPWILDRVEQRDLPHELALIPFVESSFKTDAVSPSGAAGLWQFMPATGKHFGLERDFWLDQRMDLVLATEAALDYFSALHRRFGDWRTAIAAYNVGPGTVSRARREAKRTHGSAAYARLDLPPGARRYVARIQALAHWIDQGEAGHRQLPHIADRRTLEHVRVERQIDLGELANAIGEPPEQLRRLNAAFEWSVSPPEGATQVVVPAQRAAAARAWLTARRPQPVVTWRHDARTGAFEPVASPPVERRYCEAPPGSLQAAAHTPLLQVARNQGVSLTHLQICNPTVNPVRLTRTRKLRLPMREGDWETTPLVSTAPPQHWGRGNAKTRVASRNGAIGSIRHVVASGETLGAIAQRYAVTVRKLREWNPELAVRRYLQPNDVVRILAHPSE